VAALFVFDPGPTGSIGDLSWIVTARRLGALPLLIYEGVLLNEVAKAADFVLAGASHVEKEATYTNDQGRVQATAVAIAPPGEAMEDWQILVNLGVSLGVEFAYTSAAHVRADVAAHLSEIPGYAGIVDLVFRKPVPARSWLQVSNPSERWKWDFLFRDLPPVKLKGAPAPSSRPGAARSGFDEPGQR
jgi:anaerobic selenocysteine-containing dehydrogenase